MIVRGTGFIRGKEARAKARLVAHVRYLLRHFQAAAQTPEASVQGTTANGRLFSKESDQLDRRAAVEQTMAHSLSRMRYHKMVLSPGANEPIVDFRAWTRAVFADLEQRLQLRLSWYAVVHTNTAHTHVHVVLAGAGSPLTGATGAQVPVKLRIEDYQFLRTVSRSHSEHALQGNLASLVRTLDQEDRMGTSTNAAAAVRQPFLLLLPGEGKVGTYKALSRKGSPGDQLTAHHIPAASYMKRYRIARDDGVALNMEHPAWGGGRHRLTRDYGTGGLLSETPREALARSVWNARAIYETQGLLTDDVRQALREVIQLNKSRYGALFEKPAARAGQQQ